MYRRDYHSSIVAKQHLAAAAYTATQTPTNGVDLAGYNGVEFLIHVGVITNIANSPAPSWTFKLQESDSQSSGFTDVVDDEDVLVDSALSPVTTPDGSTGVFLTVDAAAEDDKVYRAGYVGNKRYVRCVATAANTPGSTPLAITAVLFGANIQPTQDT